MSHFDLTTSPSEIVPIVALGVYRHVALKMDAVFALTRYRMTAVLDLTSEPATTQYTPQNLRVVLHALNPKPKVFITGGSISQEMAASAIGVFEDYMASESLDNTLVINVCDTPQTNRIKLYFVAKLSLGRLTMTTAVQRATCGRWLDGNDKPKIRCKVWKQ